MRVYAWKCFAFSCSVQKAARATCNRARIRKCGLGTRLALTITIVTNKLQRFRNQAKQPISMSFSGSGGRTKKKATVSASPNHHTCNLFTRCYTLFQLVRTIVPVHTQNYARLPRKGGVNKDFTSLPVLYDNAFTVESGNLCTRSNIGLFHHRYL